MRRFRFVTLDVFTDRRFGGNQLAVFTDAHGMSDAEMQSLAAEFNLSEISFVLPPADPANTARVRIFSPRAEMAYAGHPSVGTACLLAEAGRDRDGRLTMELPAGLVPVQIARDRAGRVASATIGAPQPLKIGPVMPIAAMAACASVAPDAIVTSRHAPTIASDGGNLRAIIEMTEKGLTAARPDIAAFQATVAAHPELGGRLSLYAYRRIGDRIRARMFSPLTGVWEDPATGSAATPLAGFLLHLSGADEAAWEIEQGVELGRPSLLRTAARRTADGIRASVGGGCVRVMEGEAILSD